MTVPDHFPLTHKHWLAGVTSFLLLVCFAMGPSYTMAQESPSTISVQTTEGQSLTGELIALDGQVLELVNQESNQTLAFDQIESVSFPNAVESQQPSVLQCQLADGSSFNANKIYISEAKAELELSSGEQIVIAQSSLKSLMLFDVKNDPDKLRQWDEFLPSFTAPSDAIVAEKNEALQAIEGIVGDVSDDGFNFRMGGRQVTVKAEKLTGVIFYRADREMPETLCEVRLNDDSNIAAAQIELAEGTINVVTGTGDLIALPIDVIASIDLSAGRAIYLSDLLPTTNDWKPLVASPTHLESLSKLNQSIANKSFAGQPLSLRTIPSDGLDFLATTQTYNKGFAISAGGRLAFNLNGQFQRLTALTGFDPEMDALAGKVKIEIQVDQKIALSAVLDNRQLVQPLPVDVDLTNAKRLVIRVNYHDGRSVGDRIHFVDARLSR